MNDSRSLPAPHAVAFAASLQARLTPVVDLRTGGFAGLDLRLYRLAGAVQALDGHLPTAAGFKVPASAIRELGQALLEMADELGE